MSSGVGARRLKVVLGLATLTIGTVGGSFALFAPAAQASDNLSCPAHTVEYKVGTNPLSGLADGQSAQFTVDGQTFTFTKDAGSAPFVDDTFDFTSTIAVSVAYVKGGADTNEYDFSPAATSGIDLHPPLNGGHQAPTISHVTFCVGSSEVTTTTIPETTTTWAETTTTVPETTTTWADTTTTVPETTTTWADTTTTVPETTTTWADTTTTVPETTTSTTVPDTTTSTTVPDTTTSTTVPETTTSTTVPDSTTSTTAPETSTTVDGTTTTVTVSDEGTTVASTTTTAPIGEQGVTVPSTSVAPVTVPGSLPHTGSDTAFAAMFGLSCMAAGALLLIRRRRDWSAS